MRSSKISLLFVFGPTISWHLATWVMCVYKGFQGQKGHQRKKVKTCIWSVWPAPLPPLPCPMLLSFTIRCPEADLLSFPLTGHVFSWPSAFAPAILSARNAFLGSLSGHKFLSIPLFKCQCHQKKPSLTRRSGLKVAIPTAWPFLIALPALTNVRSRRVVRARRAEPRLSIV